MRFDDSLKTVLAADVATEFGAQASWRQLVDLAGRGRVVADPALLARLAELRGTVPLPVRAASARALAVARPDAALVGFFAEDVPSVAAPVLRLATLPADAWLALLPRLTPPSRAVLRGRRDLPQVVERALEALGATDFTLTYDAPSADTDADADAEEPGTGAVVAGPVSLAASTAEVVPLPGGDTPRSPSPFRPLGEVAQRLPLVAEARRRAEEPGRFEIADIVARIDAFRLAHEAPSAAAPAVPAPVTRFAFRTDAAATIGWIDAAARAGLVGVSLALAGAQGLARVDAAVAGAVRGRARIVDGRLEIGGEGELAGSWRIVAAPSFDEASGRFAGYAGTASRAARHQSAEPHATADGLRELVHELRTPANAVAGFAEFIEAELLGPVPAVYRERASDIRRRAADLLAAINDLDTAARIDGAALDLRPGEVALAPLLAGIEAALRPLAEGRGARLAVTASPVVAAVEPAMAERLVARLLAALLSAAAAGETLSAGLTLDGREAIVAVDRPAALHGRSTAALLALAGDDGSDDGAPLLGVGFTLRLVGNLAREVGGTLDIGAARLTLRLPAALSSTMGQAATN